MRRFLLLAWANAMMAAEVIMFRRKAHRFLPDPTRFSSAGFLSVVATYFAVALLRHALVFGEPVPRVAFQTATYLAFCGLVAGKGRLRALSLWLSASIGVDVATMLFAGLGASTTSQGYAWTSFGWEVVAGACAIAHMSLDRARAARATKD